MTFKNAYEVVIKAGDNVARSREEGRRKKATAG
jgi:hypothetical protein